MKINEVGIDQDELVSQLKAQGFDVTIERRGVKTRRLRVGGGSHVYITKSNNPNGVRLYIGNMGQDDYNYQFFNVGYIDELIAELEVIKTELV